MRFQSKSLPPVYVLPIIAAFTLAGPSASALGLSYSEALSNTQLGNASSVSKVDTNLESSNGSARLSVPLRIQKINSAIGPHISVEYDSHHGNGTLGVGWRLTGLSSIQRCVKPPLNDGTVQAIKLVPGDQLCLDGERFGPVGGGMPGSGQEYVTETDKNIRIVAQGWTQFGPEAITVWTADGVKMSYGISPNSRGITPNGATLKWMLARVEDKYKNYVEYFYDSETAVEQKEVKKITYLHAANTGDKPSEMNFIYEKRPDILETYDMGTFLKLSNRIKEIRISSSVRLSHLYKFSYESSKSSGRTLLASLSECANDSTCLPAQNFSWEENGKPTTPFSASRTVASIHGLGADQWLADINGDGLPDYIAKNSDNAIHWNVNTGNGWAPPQSQGGMHGIGMSRWLVDINGDGLPDYVAKNDDGNIYWNLNNGTGFDKNAAFGGPQSQANIHALGSDRWMIDINGDALPDYVMKTNDGNIHWNINTGTGWSAPQTQSGIHGLGVVRWLKDINDDGLPDYVAKNDDGIIHWNINKGEGFEKNDVFGPSLSQTGLHSLGSDRWIIDINRDRLPDYVVKTNDGAIHWNLNTGTGWGASQSQSGVHGLGAVRWIVDMNGDGYPDFIAKNNDGNIYWNINRGTGSDQNQMFGASQQQAAVHALGADRWLIDINGDGRNDYVVKSDDGNIHDNVSLWKHPDVISAVDNQLGQKVVFEYDTVRGMSGALDLQENRFFPIISQPLLVVTKKVIKISGSPERVFTFRYSKPKFDFRRREWSGFEGVNIVDNGDNTESSLVFLQKFPLSSKLSSQSLFDAQRELIKRNTFEWARLTTEGESVLTGLVTSVAQSYVGKKLVGSTVVKHKYDEKGRRVNTAIHYGNGQTSLETVTYESFPENNIYDLVSSVEVRLGDPSRGAVVTSRRSLFSQLGEVVVAQDQAGISHIKTTDFTYDKFGNMLSRNSRATNGEVGAAQSYEYDKVGNLVRTTDALGHTTSYQYDPHSNNIVGLVEPGGSSALFEYDEFARLTRRQANDGTDEIFTYQLTGANEKDGPKTAVRRIIGGGADIREEFDGAKRLIKREELNNPFGKTRQLFRYDASGRLVGSTTRHFDKSEPLWSTVIFDSRGRETSRVFADGSKSLTSYSGQDAVTTDSLGKKTRRSYDERGRQVKSIDPSGATVSYKWDSAGNLLQTQGPDGYALWNSYDERNRLIAQDEPHLGRSIFRWGAFDQILLTKDAGGGATTLTYDKLGRLISKKRGNEISTWSFDSGRNGLGMLAKMTSGSNFSVSFEYNNSQRLTSVEHYLKGRKHTSKYNYDKHARLNRYTFPITGLSLLYDYFDNGLLRSIRMAGSQRALWTAKQYDAEGRITEEIFGNGVKSVRRYEVGNGHLTNISTLDATGRNILGITYRYDEVGNITRADDAEWPEINDYVYDSSYRLERATSDSSPSAEYRYNKSGSINSKNQEFIFEYGGLGLGPHAMRSSTEMVRDGQGVPRSTVYPLGYDNLGRVLTHKDLRFKYYSGGQLSAVTGSFQLNGKKISREIKFDLDAYDKPWRKTITDAFSDDKGAKKSEIVREYVGKTFVYEKSDGLERYLHYVKVGESVVMVIEARKITSRNESNYEWIEYSVHEDRLGSVIALTNQNSEIVLRNRYSAFGELVSQRKNSSDYGQFNFTNELGYLRLPQDPDMGIVFAGRRVYSPNLGRFLSPDPRSDFNGAQDVNKYSYAGNNPLRFFDRNGEAREYLTSDRERADRNRYFNERREWANKEIGRIRADRDIRSGHYSPRAELSKAPALARPEPIYSRKETNSYSLFPKLPSYPAGESLDSNIGILESVREIDPFGALSFWTFMVAEKQPWDYKAIYGAEWETVGNFNYGATGAALGLSDEVLLRAAGAVQECCGAYSKDFGHWYDTKSGSSFGDDPRDQENIRQGIDYYKNRDLIEVLNGSRSMGNLPEKRMMEVLPLPNRINMKSKY